MPNVGDIIFLGLIYLLFYLRPDYLFSDASVGWHLIAGNWIIAHHAVPNTGLISYLFPNSPWTDYEWLNDVIMAALVNIGGLKLLYVACASVIAFLFLLLYKRCRDEGANLVVAIVLVILGEIASSVHWLARPHLFSFVGLYLFATILADFYAGKCSVRRLALLPAAMLLWSNCHPAFLLGLVALAIYLASACLEHLFLKKDATAKILSKIRIKTLSICALTTFASTFINPYWFGNYAFIAKYFQQAQVMSVTNEFQSPIFHGDIQPLCLELLFALAMFGLAISKVRLPLPGLLMLLAFGHLSLVSVRNMPLFVIVALPIIAGLYAKTIFSPSQDTDTMFQALHERIKFIIRWLSAFDTRFRTTEAACQSHILPIVTIILLGAIAINGGKLGPVPVVMADFNSVPSATLTTIKTLKLDPRQGLSFDNWGGYISYKLGIPVFIDDRAAFYSTSFIAEYGLVCEGSPGWKQILDKYHIKWILFPTKSTLVFNLKENPQWKLVAQDQCASLYVLSDGHSVIEKNSKMEKQ